MKQAHKQKENQVNQIIDKINNSKTLMIVSIKGLPSKQFQDIKKAIRENADVQVSKKNIMLRALKGLKKDSILPLEEYTNENCALIFSNEEGYELAGILNKKKTPTFAKAGQTAPDDIEVKEGPTNLTPGPAISELGSLGIQVSVKDGKLEIKAARVILTKGQTISETAASVLQKLDIQPFSVGLIPVAIYDIESEKIYTDINIDPEGFTESLKTAAGKSLGFAQKISYYCNETIRYLLAKANSHGQALENLSPNEVLEPKAEEAKEKDNNLNKSEESQ